MRVEELSSRAGVSVDTIRYYQTKGLLDPPRREGRVAWYGDDHLRRIRRIRALRSRGFTLATIVRLLEGELDGEDAALVEELSRNRWTGSGAPPTGDPDQLYTLAQLAERTGVPLPLLKAVEAEGLLVPRRVGAEDRYTEEDVAAAGAGLALLEWGVPLSDLLALARRHHAATQEVARQAVVLFSTHVRRRPAGTDPVPAEAETDRLATAFRELLPAVHTLVAHHFTRTLLKAAIDHIELVGTEAERRLVFEEAGRILASDAPVEP